jgi:hypothetical protein
VNEIRNLRRFYLLKQRSALLEDDDDTALIWKGKQEEHAGTPLPGDFMLRARLVTVGYSMAEDLDGADEDELNAVGFSTTEARAVLNAWAALP